MFQRFVIKLIHLYQLALSPFLPAACRFIPTCSDYCSIAVQSHGVFKGIGMGMKRLLRCHPFCQGGVDPVQIKK